MASKVFYCINILSKLFLFKLEPYINVYILNKVHILSLVHTAAHESIVFNETSKFGPSEIIIL